MRQEPGEEGSIRCESCDRIYPIVFGIPDLRIAPDHYASFEADREKARLIAERFHELSFVELVDHYYSVTPKVPTKDAKQYTQGLLGAEARSLSNLGHWEQSAPSEPDGVSLRLLDVGCGTAPLLVAGAPRYASAIGIDQALRWLVIGKKRLAEAGLDTGLICANAEALPFPDSQFHRVALDSCLEVVADRVATLRECHRVCSGGGRLFLSTPNRFSLGPDPHTGVWGGGMLPERVTTAYVKKKGGVPPVRKLLWAGRLKTELSRAGFDDVGVGLPDVPPNQSAQYGWGVRRLIDLYNVAKRLPVGRQVMRTIGPTLLASARKRP